MTEIRSTVAPWHLWAVGLAALLWNGFGTFAWALTTFAADAIVDLPADQRAYVLGLPLWSSLAWAIGVLGGVAGAVLLLLRSRLAVPAFGASLLGAAANQLVYVTNPPPPGFVNVGLVAFILGFALFLFLYARATRGHGVLR